jgi:hypothetical protein
MGSMRLSSRGLARAVSFSHDDFVFIGNGIEMHCTQFQAAYISPRVHLLLLEDATLSSFVVKTRHHHIKWKRIFELLEQLMNGVAITPGKSDLSALADVAASLGNFELLNQFPDDGGIDLGNVCRRLRKNHASSRTNEAEVHFAASHFCELDFEDMKDLDLSILERIVSSPDLHVKDEDSLLEIISKIDGGVPVLLRHVCTEFLTRDSMSVFLDWVSPSALDPVIWSALCRRFLLREWANSADFARSRFTHPRVFLRFASNVAPDNPLDGIIAFLTREYGGNVHDKGIVTITSRSVKDGQYAPRKVVDLTSLHPFVSQENRGEWLCWDFRKMSIRPTRYTLRAPYLARWVLEGSWDGEAWTVLDRQADISVRPFATTNWFVPCRPRSFTVSNPVTAGFSG